jgi:hypothetical protein
MWVPHPNDVIALPPQMGVGDMGDVADEGSTARFMLDADRFVLIYVRGLWTGGTGKPAPLYICVDHRCQSGLYDFVLDTIADIGTDGRAHINHRILVDELYQYVFHRGDIIVLTWTNPDAGNMQWAVEVGLADASQLQQ